MDSLEGSIAVNQVFYAKYTLRRVFLLEKKKKKEQYLTERSQERYS